MDGCAIIFDDDGESVLCELRGSSRQLSDCHRYGNKRGPLRVNDNEAASWRYNTR